MITTAAATAQVLTGNALLSKQCIPTNDLLDPLEPIADMIAKTAGTAIMTSLVVATMVFGAMAFFNIYRDRAQEYLKKIAWAWGIVVILIVLLKVGPNFIAALNGGC